MKRVICCIALVTVVSLAFAVEKEITLSQLDDKVTKNLSGELWDQTSKTFVRTVWEDYKKAYMTSDEGGSRESLFGKMPDIQSYDQYVGHFSGQKKNGKPLFLGIIKDEQGRFSVKLEGYTIPALTQNGCILFTTGDVVYSYLPRLGEKPYCTLELFMIIFTEDTFYFTSQGMPPEVWMTLSKHEVTK